jgi:hypothetical protein
MQAKLVKLINKTIFCVAQKNGYSMKDRNLP